MLYTAVKPSPHEENPDHPCCSSGHRDPRCQIGSIAIYVLKDILCLLVSNTEDLLNSSELVTLLYLVLVGPMF